MMNLKYLCGLLMGVVITFQTLSVDARSAMIDGTAFSQTIETEQKRLYLKGSALLRYLIFIKAYVGAFYLPKDADGSQALEDISKHLVLEYRVAIPAEDFAMATREKIKDSVDADEFQRLLPKIEALNRLYRSVEPGDRYSLTYIPGAGTELRYNEQPLGTIAGADFAKALFSIWIGENPIDSLFRDRLLGKYN